MVDDIDNQVDYQGPAWELPLLLLGAVRSLVDDAHARLAEQGHPGVRPVHGFTLQAIGAGSTVSEVGRRLGVTKQAAARTVQLLEDDGYVARETDPSDRRSARVVVTDRGRALLAASADAFDAVVTTWSARVGPERVADLRRTLVDLDTGQAARLDLGAWAGQTRPGQRGQA